MFHAETDAAAASRPATCPQWRLALRTTGVWSQGGV